MLVSRRSSGERLERMLLTFDPLHWPEDAPTVVAFLASNEWPFHPVPLLSPTDAKKVSVEADDIATFWIRSGDEAVGLIRLLDLDDLDVASPLFDLRVADGHRGLGVGRQAVRWLTDHLFTTYPELHRIEATTRVDNQAMQKVFAHCSWRLEGRFVEAWTNADGTQTRCRMQSSGGITPPSANSTADPPRSAAERNPSIPIASARPRSGTHPISRPRITDGNRPGTPARGRAFFSTSGLREHRMRAGHEGRLVGRASTIPSGWRSAQSRSGRPERRTVATGILAR